METTESISIENITDPRQSDAWGEHLRSYGWKLQRTKSGILVAVMKMPFIGSIIKIQRPRVVTEEDLLEIEELSKKTKALFVKIDLFVGQDVEIFKKYGYVTSSFPLCPTKTMFVDLNLDFDSLWARVSHSGKYSINRARREGAKLYFYRNPSKEKMEEYYKVLSYTGHRKHFYVEPFKNVWVRKEAFGTDSFLIMVYGKEGKVEGGKFFMAYKDDVVYNTGGTTEAGRHTKSGYLLTWEALLYFKRLGYKYLDLEGLYDTRFPSFTSGWEGFSHFKDKFNGEIIEMPVPQIKYISPVIKAMVRLSPMGM